jgi:hypothetical protein
MYPFEGLWIWALSLEVDKLVYKLSYKLPKTEQFGGWPVRCVGQRCLSP